LRPQNLEIWETLSDLTHLLDRLVGEKVQLRLEYDPVKRAVRADKRQLEQVVMNLVVNARDSMPEGGEILISTAGTKICEPMFRDRVAVPKGAYVSISIQDKVCGIASDKLQKIVEPFYTTKRTGEGTGLGLSTVYGIVKQTGATFSWIAALVRARSSPYFCQPVICHLKKRPPRLRTSNGLQIGRMAAQFYWWRMKPLCIRLRSEPCVYAGILFWLLNRVKGR
jgi:signal transduction histidine kinase